MQMWPNYYAITAHSMSAIHTTCICILFLSVFFSLLLILVCYVGHILWYGPCTEKCQPQMGGQEGWGECCCFIRRKPPLCYCERLKGDKNFKEIDHTNSSLATRPWKFWVTINFMDEIVSKFYLTLHCFIFNPSNLFIWRESCYTRQNMCRMCNRSLPRWWPYQIVCWTLKKYGIIFYCGLLWLQYFMF